MNDNNNNGRWVHPEGQRPQGQHPQGQRPQGQRPQGQRPQGQRPQGQRPQGQRPQGQHPQGQRPSGRGGAKKRSTFGARILLFLAIFGVLCLIFAAVFFMFFYSTPDKADGSIKISYGTKITDKVPAETAYRDNELYVSFTRIAEYLSLSRTGDAKHVRFVFASPDAAAEGNAEEYVEFYNEERMAFVSGTEIRLTAPAYIAGDDVWVPAEFIRSYTVGLVVEENKSGSTVKIHRELFEETLEDGKHVEAEVTLSLKAALAPLPVETEEEATSSPTVVFVTDLSEYEQYMNPEDDKEFLVLVNKTNTVDASLAPNDLIDVKATRSDRSPRQMRATAEKALEALYIEMSAAGYNDVSVTSAYRSYEEQQGLYASYVAQEMAAGITEEQARAIVDTYSAREGTSEHQTGLCCDMHNLPSADQAFASRDAFLWLKDNAWKFGFIERFPKGKEGITGYSFEPWHYRFVGRRAAYAIHNAGITLEEYLERD